MEILKIRIFIKNEFFRNFLDFFDYIHATVIFSELQQ